LVFPSDGFFGISLVMKKISFFITIILSSFIFSACTNQKTPTTQNSSNPVSQETKSVGKCTLENVDIEGYGDKGKKLSNCFIEYPGEPSRQDKSYYIVEDICGQFTKEFISNALGKNIIKSEPSFIDGVYTCSYYTTDKDFVMLILDYLKISNQQKFYELGGKTVKSEDFIPMRNLVVYKSNGEIQTLYWVLNDEKFISLERSIANPLTTDEIKNFATNIGKEIKNYK
jgi:uncharacterized protein YxeA